MAGSSDIILLMLTVLRRSVIREVESLPRGRKKKEGGCKVVGFPELQSLHFYAKV